MIENHTQLPADVQHAVETFGPVGGSPLRVYLSGPMSGIPDNNFPAFHRWAAKLRADGFEVVSPAEIEEAGTWELCLRADLRELCSCDAIALMPGWENSRGAHLELHVAHRLGMKVMHLTAPAFELPSAEGLKCAADALIAEAARLGLVLTIEQRPLQPLAMGHHETVATVQPARGRQ